MKKKNRFPRSVSKGGHALLGIVLWFLWEHSAGKHFNVIEPSPLLYCNHVTALPITFHPEHEGFSSLPLVPKAVTDPEGCSGIYPFIKKIMQEHNECEKAVLFHSKAEGSWRNWWGSTSFNLTRAHGPLAAAGFAPPQQSRSAFCLGAAGSVAPRAAIPRGLLSVRSPNSDCEQLLPHRVNSQ